jgi:hypothetical protein
MTLLITSIGASDERPGQSRPNARISSALLSVVCCEVRYKVWRSVEVDEMTSLLLETVDHLQQCGRVRLEDLANVTGLELQFASRIVIRLIDQALLTAEQGQLRLAEGVERDGSRVRMKHDVTEEVLALGVPPWPVRGRTPDNLGTTAPHRKAAALAAAIDGELLQRWLADCWPSGSDIALGSRVRPEGFQFFCMWSLEPSKVSVTVVDERARQSRIEVSDDHPHVRELREHLRRLTSELPAALERFGIYRHETGTLTCTARQWEQWSGEGGGLLGTATAQDQRSGISVAVDVACVPADAPAAQAMMGDLLLRELEKELASSDVVLDPATLIERLVGTVRGTTAFKNVPFSAPTIRTMSELAWDRGRWELSYRLAQTEDGL